MKIGYPCINRTLICQGNRTFRLRSYSRERLLEVVENNLLCLGDILQFNFLHGIFFFRISSDLVPFASHRVCRVPWQKIFRPAFKTLGDFIKKHNMRISMHPDQFTLINSIDRGIFERSVKELLYHGEILDLMGLGDDAKIQIHVGGVYSDKLNSLQRFIRRYRLLPGHLCKRLVIENDERCYSAGDCLKINQATGIPVLFDVFHDSILASGIPRKELMRDISLTWRKSDGIMMLDYSSQQKAARPGSHARVLNVKDFSAFLKQSRPFDFDIMLEIKDKESSAIKAIKIASKDPRFKTI